MQQSKMKWVDHSEAWYKTWCPHCETGNFHCNGNESDLSGIDVDAVKCCKCGEVYLLSPPDADLVELLGGELYENEADGQSEVT